MAREILPDAVTAEDIIAACGGMETENAVPSPYEVCRRGKIRRLRWECASGYAGGCGYKRNAFAWHSILGEDGLSIGRFSPVDPIDYLCGDLSMFGDRKYTVVSILIMLEAMLPFLLLFERRKPQARELVVVAVLCAVGVAGRTVFAVLPGFSPVMAVVILSGIALGAETGFLIGAVTMFVSNFFFGQGPWTPWQMFAMGLIGFLSGILFAKRRVSQKKWRFCTFGAAAAIVVYGGIMNPASVLMYQSYPTWEMIAAAYLTGFPVDAAQAVATVCFLWMLATPFLEKIERIRRKYGLVNEK